MPVDIKTLLIIIALILAIIALGFWIVERV